jgi:hypothetical protein
VFCLMNIFHLFIYFGYLLSFVFSIDTFDLLTKLDMFCLLSSGWIL